MKIQSNSRARRQSGYSALFITLILVSASVLLLGATLTRTTSSSRLNDRNTQFISTEGAAEAAVEKVLSRMMVDFANTGESLVQNNLTLYRTGLLPTSAENPYWANFNFSDGTGNSNAIYVARTTTNVNAPYIALSEQYIGLSGYASTYRIMANATMKSSTYNYNFTNAVQQDVQLAQIPIFQFAIFYNGLLEFSDTATLNITGPVHANSNIYVGSPSDLTFNSIVTATGNITSPANAGFSRGSWSGDVTYNGSPTPGYLTGQPALTLPIGTNSTSGANVMQILYPSNNTQSAAMISQLYTTKAHMVLMISNASGSVPASFYATFKSSAADPNPITFSAPLSYLTSNSWVTSRGINTNANWGTGSVWGTTNWGWNWDWLSTTTTFYDWRETAQITVAQVDVSKLTNWMNTWLKATYNTNVYAKFSANNPFNIIYIGDWRYPNEASGNLSAVRLINGANIPVTGLTVATPDPLYIQGNYNTPGGVNVQTMNTSLCHPASVACDALTILSPGWSDVNATSSSGTRLNINAQNDTVNCAIIAGIVPSTGTGSSQYSGGANNLPRLLEDWRGANLYLNTSIVCLFSSTWATSPFILPGNYYYAPALRSFAFDQNYTVSSNMPPGTPNICRAIRSAWCNPTPGSTNFNYSFSTDFVPN